MIITFGGHNGSGKTAVSRRVAEAKGYEWVNMGRLFRDYAHDKGVSLAEAEDLFKTDSDFDIDADREVQRIGEERDDVVIDARAAFHFVPRSVKVFLSASPDARAARAFKGQRQGELYASVAEAGASIEERMDTFRQRLSDLYGIDIFDPANFDIVVDTSELTEDEVVERVLEALDQL